MANTIQQSFLELKENLEITQIQSETVSTRQNNVRDVLKKDLEVLDSFLTGSYSRKTMISPLTEADIDIFIVLDPKYYHNYNGRNGGQAGLLDLIKRTLKKEYPKTPDISRDGQAITISFSDFKVDVVPGFRREGGGFIIADSIRQKWVSTNPKVHVDVISASNKTHNGDLIPIIKMIKGWNKENGSYFRSFHLETITFQILENVTISDYPSAVRYVFDKCRDYITKENPDPSGFNNDIGNYLDNFEKVQAAVNKFQRAYERAINAESEAIKGNIKYAVEYWVKIFGNYFPSYG